jgi:hypothetical protein
MRESVREGERVREADTKSITHFNYKFYKATIAAFG